MSFKADIAREIARALLGWVAPMLPAAAVVKGIGEKFIDRTLARAEQPPASIVRMIEAISGEIASDLTLYADQIPSERDAGALRSAIHDFVAALSDANITALTILDLDFNPARIAELLVADGIDPMGSAKRKDHFIRIANRFSVRLVERLPTIPEFRSLLITHTLGRLSLLREALDRRDEISVRTANIRERSIFRRRQRTRIAQPRKR